jgi:methionine sulfoxide reductase catalytic subunit
MAMEYTAKRLYLNRREFMRTASGAAAAATGVLAATARVGAQPAPHGRRLENVGRSALSTAERPNRWEHITSYNNYYEFGIEKDQPSRTSRALRTAPWTVAVAGECNKKASYHLEDILAGQALEDRIYRHRCVEGWSMVIPWVGFPLGDFLKRCEPTSKARYVEFTTLDDPKQMPGMRSGVLRWPYVEGLRLDEAMHPLTILAVGLYGEALPNQNGAPLRLVVPWKYGFKSIKAIVKITFTEKEPVNTWQVAAPALYGFYSNVNPSVGDQGYERRLGEFMKRKTLMFNGYADQVGGMYAGMNLRRYF